MNPVDLAVDSLSETLYWVNSTGVVMATNFSGSYQWCVYQFTNGEVPIAVAVFGDFLYVALENSNRIARVDRLQRIGVCVCT